VLGWAAAYVALVLAASVVVRARREPTIVRGDWIFLLTALYVLIGAAVTALRGGRLSLGVLSGAVVVLLAGWFIQSRWWVIGQDSGAVVTAIEECASRLCAPSARGSDHLTLAVPGGVVHLRVAPVGRSTMIVFVASARHRKVQLFRRLLAKQYKSVMPTIRLGGPERSRNT
jgi:hypothetical protein